MQLFKSDHTVTTNVTGITSFSMRQSAKAFQILSNNIYSNKIAAVVRELGTNAYDSHVEAGKGDQPFEIHLPNMIEPWFSVTDHGTGLSPEQIESLYVTYFDSTKTESNDYVGALGLGSKSPYCYTDQFNIVSRYNGTEHTFTAFVNDAGVPSMANMGSRPTDQHNGVSIIVPVRSDDFKEFERIARSIYERFDVIPIVANGKDIEPMDLIPTPDPHVFEMGSNFYYRQYQPMSIALMGNVAYPLFETSSQAHEILGKYHGYATGLVYRFDIGELDFQASREHLSYIPQTISAIRNRIKEFHKSVLKDVNDKKSQFDTEWQQKVYLNKIRNTKTYFSALRLIVDRYIDVSPFMKDHDVKMTHYQLRLGVRKTLSTSEAETVMYDTDPMFFTIAPGTTAYKKRIRSYLESHPEQGTVYTITGPDTDKLIEYLGNPPIHTEQDLPAHVTARTNTINPTDIVELNRNNFREGPMWQAAKNLDQTKYYVRVSGYNPVDLDVDLKELQSDLMNSNNPELRKIRITGVRKHAWDRLGSNYIELIPHIRSVLENIPNPMAFSTTSIPRWIRDLTKDEISYVKDNLPIDNPLVLTVQYCHETTQLSKKMTNLFTLCNVPFDNMDHVHTMIDKYPLLDHNPRSVTIEHIVQYVKTAI